MVYKATFSYNKMKERFAVADSNEHVTHVLMPGPEQEQVLVTSPRPFRVEIFRIGEPSVPQIVKGKYSD